MSSEGTYDGRIADTCGTEDRKTLVEGRGTDIHKGVALGLPEAEHVVLVATYGLPVRSVGAKRSFLF